MHTDCELSLKNTQWCRRGAIRQQFTLAQKKLFQSQDLMAAGIACIFSVAGNLTQLEKNCLSSRRFINQEDDFSVGTLKEVE